MSRRLFQLPLSLLYASRLPQGSATNLRLFPDGPDDAHLTQRRVPGIASRRSIDSSSSHLARANEAHLQRDPSLLAGPIGCAWWGPCLRADVPSGAAHSGPLAEMRHQVTPSADRRQLFHQQWWDNGHHDIDAMGQEATWSSLASSPSSCGHSGSPACRNPCSYRERSSARR